MKYTKKFMHGVNAVPRAYLMETFIVESIELEIIYDWIIFKTI